MANHKSALKRHRQSLKRRARNRISKTRIKNTVKAVRVAIEEKDVAQAQDFLRTLRPLWTRLLARTSSTPLRPSAASLVCRLPSIRSKLSFD